MATTQSSSPFYSAQHFAPSHTKFQPLSADMKFAEAADLYMQARATVGQVRYIKDSTKRSYRGYIESLKLFFADRPLRDIDWFDMRKYQEARVAGAPPFIRKRRPHQEAAPCPCNPAKVNQELNLLRSLKLRTQCWTDDDAMYFEKLLEVESEIPRALTMAEEDRWLQVSRSRLRWLIVHWYSMLSFRTCMSTNEIRALHIGHVNLDSQIVTVPAEGAKTRYRIRTIGLDPDARWAAEQLLARAKELGSVEPQHYLFPFRDIRANRYIPGMPMTVNGIRKTWEEVREASGLKWFRPYDTRHTAITRLAESGMGISMIMDMAGHISPLMTRHYTHITDQAKVKAMQQVQRYRYSNSTEEAVPPQALPEPRQRMPVQPPALETSAPVVPLPTLQPVSTVRPAPFSGGFYTTSWTW